MSSIMTKDWVDSEMKKMSMFFTLMVIIINKIFNSIVSSDELYVLENYIIIKFYIMIIQSINHL
jgi:hypothetical protein